MREPVYSGYLADPFLVRTPDGYIVYGTGDPAEGGTFEAIVSDDLSRWRSIGRVLERPDPVLGSDFWAPEVVFDDGRYWMFYSVGHGIAGHHIRVASCTSPLGPFVDEGVNLTPDESFAIDAHPFHGLDGSWYLFFARDVLDSPTRGTHLAVVRLATMTSTEGEVRSVLSPYAPWQIFERDRLMNGQIRDWYTLEGPTVVQHDAAYYLFFSGGSWEGPGYGVAYATAPGPLGPWKPQGGEGPTVLNSTSVGLIGPGHNSILRLDSGQHLIAYHAWNSARSRRQTFIDPLNWVDGVPMVAPNRQY
jgi:arabinan endo-1,5-alpha-L-arabinosidase